MYPTRWKKKNRLGTCAENLLFRLAKFLGRDLHDDFLFCRSFMFSILLIYVFNYLLLLFKKMKKK